MFENFNELKAYLKTIFNLSDDEAHDFGEYLIRGLHILWDTGYQCYSWPDSLSMDDAYMHLENAMEERAESAECCPF